MAKVSSHHDLIFSLRYLKCCLYMEREKTKSKQTTKQSKEHIIPNKRM